MHKFIKQTVYTLTIALLLPATFMAAETSDQTRTRKEAIQLTQQIEGAARKVQTHSDHLSAMKRNSMISNRTHQHQLQRIASEVNEQLRPTLDRLAEIQPDLPEWNQKAVDQMRQSAVTLAANTNAAVLNRNEAGSHQPTTLNPDYGQLLENIHSNAETLVQVADAAADYGNAQLKGTNAGLSIASHN